MSESEWRSEWADYFEKRAQRSEAREHKQSDKAMRKEHADVTHALREVVATLRGSKSLDDLTAELGGPDPHTANLEARRHPLTGETMQPSIEK